MSIQVLIHSIENSCLLSVTLKEICLQFRSKNLFNNSEQLNASHYINTLSVSIPGYPDKFLFIQPEKQSLRATTPKPTRVNYLPIVSLQPCRPTDKLSFRSRNICQWQKADPILVYLQKEM